jgi:cathepsin X
VFPNATVSEYGTYSYFTGGFGEVAHKIKAEIYARGYVASVRLIAYGIQFRTVQCSTLCLVESPVAAGVNADPLIQYEGGIVNDTKIWHMLVNHIVSIVGWGTDPTTGEQFWIARNSWGQYWGEFGFFRIVMGRNSLGIESEVAWASPGDFTINNYPCNEDASNCGGAERAQQMMSASYIDPSNNPTALLRRLKR